MVSAVVLGTNLVVGAAALGWVLYRHGAPALALLAERPAPLLLAAFAAVVGAAFLVYARRWQSVLAGLGTRCALGALVAYRAAGHSLSALIPSARLGGEPLRAFLLLRDGVPAGQAVASVAVDRTLEMGASAPFAFVYAAMCLRRGVPELEGAFVTVGLGATALLIAVALTARRLLQGRGLVTAAARSMGLERLPLVHGPMRTVAEAEAAAARLVAQRALLARVFTMGLGVNLLVVLEYHLLLAAFGLPAGPVAVAAALFATGAAHSLPVPAAVGTLEGAQMWLFQTLGHPPEVGLAVGLAVRLRELFWVAPGLVYLAARAVRGSEPGWRRRPGYDSA